MKEFKKIVTETNFHMKIFRINIIMITIMLNCVTYPVLGQLLFFIPKIQLSVKTLSLKAKMRRKIVAENSTYFVVYKILKSTLN